jgi:beta-galactosidase GanA
MDFARRLKDGKPLKFLMNFSGDAQTVELTGRHRDLLTGSVFAGRVDIPSVDLRILVES